MKEVIDKSKQLNQRIKDSSEYKNYLDTKKRLCDNIDLCNQLKEFKRRNQEIQNRHGVNPYDEVIMLTREYDELLNNSIVNEFLMAERHICKLMQKVCGFPFFFVPLQKILYP
jgi:cell fate (sporulation/competence/biofilm development) regulator YlbF (YheA/YmcA/DUF963 family)